METPWMKLDHQIVSETINRLMFNVINCNLKGGEMQEL